MADDFSDEFITRFQQKYLKARQKAARDLTWQTLGAAGDIMQGKDATTAFKQWAPAQDTMSRREKLQAFQAGSKALGGIEQWQTKAAIGREEKRLDRELERQRAALQAELAKLTASTTSAGRAAQLGSNRWQSLYQQNQVDQKELDSLTKADQAVVEGAVTQALQDLGTSDAYVKAKMKEMDQLGKAQAKASGVDYIPPTPEQLEQFETALRGQHSDKVAERLAGMSEDIIQDAEPGKGSLRVEAIAAGLGISTDAVVAAAGLDSYVAEDREARETMRENLEDDEVRMVEDWRRTTKSTYGSTTGVDEAADSLVGAIQNRRQFRRQASAPATEFGTAPAATEAAPAATEAAPAATEPAAGSALPDAGPTVGGAAPTSRGLQPQQAPQAETFLGLPVKPAGTEAERTIQWMDMYEKYPEYSPLKEARNAMMETEQFKRYQQQRGYTDPDLAFKEMAREMKAKVRARKQETRRNIRKNIRDGTAEPTGLRFKGRTPEPTRRSLVSGDSDDSVLTKDEVK
jgi:hypothetical protein